MRYGLSPSHCSLHELYLLSVLRTAILLAAEADFPSPAGNCLAPFSLRLYPWLIAHEPWRDASFLHLFLPTIFQSVPSTLWKRQSDARQAQSLGQLWLWLSYLRCKSSSATYCAEYIISVHSLKPPLLTQLNPFTVIFHYFIIWRYYLPDVTEVSPFPVLWKCF